MSGRGSGPYRVGTVFPRGRGSIRGPLPRAPHPLDDLGHAEVCLLRVLPMEERAATRLSPLALNAQAALTAPPHVQAALNQGAPRFSD